MIGRIDRFYYQSYSQLNFLVLVLALQWNQEIPD
jgi:hypothetical protein